MSEFIEQSIASYVKTVTPAKASYIHRFHVNPEEFREMCERLGCHVSGDGALTWLNICGLRVAVRAHDGVSRGGFEFAFISKAEVPETAETVLGQILREMTRSLGKHHAEDVQNLASAYAMLANSRPVFAKPTR